MAGNIIMVLSAALSLQAPVHGISAMPAIDPVGSHYDLTIRITNADDSRIVSSGETGKLVFANRIFVNDWGIPFSITVSSNSNPLIPGTTVPIYKIAALLDGGATVASVSEDYPSLTSAQIEDARAYAKVNPYSGRPYAKTSLKRALRNMDFDEYLAG